MEVTMFYYRKMFREEHILQKNTISFANYVILIAKMYFCVILLPIEGFYVKYDMCYE